MSQQPVSPHEAPLRDPDNLPVRLPELLLGRDSDIAAVHLALKADRPTLLYGAPGSGKSALAAAIAVEYANQDAGVLWLDLAEDSLRSLLARVARAYGAMLPPESAQDEQIAIVRDVLQANRQLIVLDGVVNIRAARAFVRECAADLPLLLTHSHAVRGPWKAHAVQPLNRDDCEALLLLVAGPSIDAEVGEINRVAEFAGGYPLGVMIAGHALAASGLAPAEFLDHMPTLPRGAINRLLGLIMAAYRLMPSSLQGTLLLLGTTFAGGASETLLADVTGTEAETLRPALRELVKRGFASRYEVYGQPYYKAHELVRHFAKAFLRGKDQLEAIREHQLDGLVQYVRRYASEDDSAAHDRLAAEFGSVLAAARYAARHGRKEQLEELVLLLDPSDEGDFAAARGFEVELKWMWHLVEDPAAANAPLLAWRDDEIEDDEEDDALPALTEPEGEALLSAPEASAALPAPETAPDEAIPAPERDDDSTAAEAPAAEAAEAVASGVDASALETSAPAEPASTPEALAPVAHQAVLRGDADQLRTMAERAVEERDTEHALEYYAQALEAYHANGDVSDELAALEALAALSLERADYEQVLDYVDRGMSLADELNDPQREGKMLILLGDLQSRLGREDGAEVAYREAINALRPTEAWLTIGQTLDKLGALYLDSGRPQDALAVMDQAVPIFEHMERGDLLLEALDKLGEAQSGLLNWSAARQTFERAYQLAQVQGDQERAYEQLSQLGAVLEESGHYDDALPVYRHALYLAFELDDAYAIGFSMLALARLMIDDTVQLNRVVQLLDEAVQRMPENTEARRLLSRAKTRQERLTSAGVTLLLPEDDLRSYARAAVEEDGGLPGDTA